jgi:hypothetical protein
MQIKQKAALIVTALIIVGMMLHPPYRLVDRWGQTVESGYAWIFNLPEYTSIYISLLLMQWIAVLIGGVIAFLVLRDS